MAAYHKVEVSLNTNAVEVGIPSPQTVNVVVPTIGPAGPVGSVGPTGPQGPQGVPGTGLEVLTTQGDILYQGASTGQRLAIGTSGQVLKVANGIPAWGNESGAVTSVNGETGTVILDGSDIDSSTNDARAAFTVTAVGNGDGDGIYYPLVDTFINTKNTYRTTSGYSVFFENARWHIADGSPITANIIESSDDDNAAWPWLSAWSGDVLKAKLADVVGRARDTFLFVGDSVPSTSVSGLGTAATSDSTAFAAASHKSSHATGGTDALAPSDIGAQSLFTISSIIAATTLSAGRARLFDVSNYSSAYTITLPITASQEGDIAVFRSTNFINASVTIGYNPVGGSPQTLVTITEVDKQYRFIYRAGPQEWTPVAVDTHTHAASAITSGTLDVARLPVGTGSTQVAAGNHTHVVADVTGAAASGSITTSGLTQATARILGRTSSSTGSIEEIQIGSGLSLSAGELSATSSGGITAVGASTADVLSVSGSDLVADDPNADRIIFWDDSESKLRYLEAGSGLSLSGTTLTATATGTIGGSTSTDNAIVRADSTANTVQESNFLIADNATASPNNTVNHASIQATGGTTNVSVSIVPKGTGALSLHVPDATSTGGNARGTRACDFQRNRSTAAQVASGDDSFIAGGNTNTASGANSFIGGGIGNVASGSSSACVGSWLGTASSNRATVISSYFSTASQEQTTVINGSSSSATQTHALAVGHSAVADLACLIAEGFGAIGATGSSQALRYMVRGTTTTNSAVELFGGTGANVRLRCPSGKVMFMDIMIVGVANGGGTVATFQRQYAIKNVSGTTSEVYAPVTIGSDNAASTSITVDANDTNDALRIQCTGLSATTIRWVAHVSAVEVAYG
jgi:hypothetical protein